MKDVYDTEYLHNARRALASETRAGAKLTFMTFVSNCTELLMIRFDYLLHAACAIIATYGEVNWGRRRHADELRKCVGVIFGWSPSMMRHTHFRPFLGSIAS